MALRILALIAALGLAACASSGGEAEPPPMTDTAPPPPTTTEAAPPPPPVTVTEPEGPREPRFPAADGITVPRGFRAEVYARGLTQPTALAWGPRNLLYAAQNDGRIVVVRPNDRSPRTYADGYEVPLGLTWFHGHLYVSAQGTLYRDRQAIVTGLPFGLHQQDNVVPGPDGRLYLGSGSTCNACAEEHPRSAAVLSVRPDGSDLRVEATGLRNPYGLAWHGGRLFASVNGRDDLGAWNPAEMVVEVERGADYGWPDCWPDWSTRGLDGDCAGVTPPVAYLEPHSSADGIAFWRGRLYVAEWGEYLDDVHGRRVVRVNVETGRVAPFADGFEHPLALAVDRWGGLLVADWETGVIYRIRPA
jgi:glucose/arabinose dehydrogenase